MRVTRGKIRGRLSRGLIMALVFGSKRSQCHFDHGYGLPFSPRAPVGTSVIFTATRVGCRCQLVVSLPRAKAGVPTTKLCVTSGRSIHSSGLRALMGVPTTLKSPCAISSRAHRAGVHPLSIQSPREWCTGCNFADPVIPSSSSSARLRVLAANECESIHQPKASAR